MRAFAFARRLRIFPKSMSFVPGALVLLQGYLADKKTPPRRTLRQAYPEGPMKVLRGVAVSYERGNPVGTSVVLFVDRDVQVLPGHSADYQDFVPP